MASVRWSKVRRDLVALRTRTVLVVASITVGVVAVGTIAGSQAVLDEALHDGYEAARTSNAILYTDAPFDPSIVEVVRRIPGVAVAEGRHTVSVRLKTGDTWRQLQLTAVPDFRHQGVDVVLPASGAFPPKRGEILFERSVESVINVTAGQDVTIGLPNGRTKTVHVAGLAHEPGASPAYYFGRLNAYTTFDTLEDLGFGRDYQEVRIRAADPAVARPQVQALADQVRFRLEKAGPAVSFSLIPAPGKHPAQELLDAIFIVLGGLGFLSLFVSGFLVANTIGVIMTQQTRQIGVMKAVGGSTRDVALLYMGLVSAYSALALLIAVPVAALTGLGLATFVTGLVNVDIHQAFIPVSAIAVEIAVGFLVPLLAALVPIVRGTRVTVHQAIRYTGVPETFGRGRLDRSLQAIRGLPRPALLAVRNTFRRKGRLALTLIALAMGGAVFMSVFTVRQSLLGTLNETFRYFNYDVQLDLAHPVRASSAIQQALAVPGAAYAEAWQYASAVRERPDGTETTALATFGLPSERADSATHRRAGALAAARRGPRAGRDGKPASRRTGPAHRRQGPPRDARPYDRLDPRRRRPVTDDGPVPVCRIGRARRRDGRERPRRRDPGWRRSSGRHLAGRLRDLPAGTVRGGGDSGLGHHHARQHRRHDRDALRHPHRARDRDGGAARRRRRSGPDRHDDDERRRAGTRNRRAARGGANDRSVVQIFLAEGAIVGVMGWLHRRARCAADRRRARRRDRQCVRAASAVRQPVLGWCCPLVGGRAGVVGTRQRGTRLACNADHGP